MLTALDVGSATVAASCDGLAGPDTAAFDPAAFNSALFDSALFDSTTFDLTILFSFVAEPSLLLPEPLLRLIPRPT